METIVLSPEKDCSFESHPEAVDWELVFRQHGKRLQNFIRQRVNNKEDVEDLQQMTYLEVLRNREKFAGASRPETWVFGIALNLVRNYYKQAKSPVCDISEDELEKLSCGSDPSRIIEWGHALHRVLAASAHLPDDTRHMLVMLIDADASYQDIAERLGMPIGTVRSRLSRARGFLRQAVDA
ncbi:RNA polymerase sigma factor [Lonsdalea populi]|uniref:RNA polymerase sigma factor n=1 Tax=Lonsdalea populi TaxID=1172565 RepID=UPI000A23ECC8|nr:sigma-70 family RNA polymerase sigma factor [Lonsdalea populi]OSM99588.1 RNA polymerase subunit sigma [Lonsdalea populi]RAT68101.1 RNA polymerase subunit sigma [Lonsdalea populi]RAT70340.1 RNA polymerase subunit sigma [Lonsdalea populi]RAT77864.1 RNA polymerase subunit sigma [Lonsdalea populi]RAT79271.1 RNA polymerase subunit sigma [Lonsdalea populi]